MVTLIQLPLEIRRMIYRQLLAIDHNSDHWGWDLERIGALNRRHQITRVNSQIRNESQKYFYASVPWIIRLGYSHPGAIWIKGKLVEILVRLQRWGQLNDIRHVAFHFDISASGQVETRLLKRLYLGRKRKDKNYKHHGLRPYVFGHLCKMFAGVLHVDITWIDSARTIPWSQNQLDLFEPLAEFRRLKTCKIYHVSTDGQCDGKRGFLRREDLVDRIREVGIKGTVAVNPNLR